MIFIVHVLIFIYRLIKSTEKGKIVSQFVSWNYHSVSKIIPFFKSCLWLRGFLVVSTLIRKIKPLT